MIFHVTLEHAEDGWVVAECPALPGCVSQGIDEKEALENIKEAITAWIVGRRPESPEDHASRTSACTRRCIDKSYVLNPQILFSARVVFEVIQLNSKPWGHWQTFLAKRLPRRLPKLDGRLLVRLAATS